MDEHSYFKIIDERVRTCEGDNKDKSSTDATVSLKTFQLSMVYRLTPTQKYFSSFTFDSAALMFVLLLL